MTKLIWHSNSPWSPTGYGCQTALVAPHLATRYDLAVSSFYGLEGAPLKWGGIPVLPGLGGEYGNSSLPQHAKRFFGEPRDGMVVTLMDVWVLDPNMARGLNMACWVPVDHEPAPPKVIEFFMQSEAVPIAMSRFGQRELGRLDPLYVPHAVDTEVYRPHSTHKARNAAFPDGAFVVGMIAANKGRPSRKGFSQAFQAFARFAEKHDNAFLYLHTVLDQNMGAGENLSGLLRGLGVPDDRVRVADQYAMLHKPYSGEEMSQVYSAMDVLLSPSLGEGFGIPILEAQACGVPCVVTDFSAMSEVCSAGWKVSHTPYWTGLDSWQAVPDVDAIVQALEECHGLSKDARRALAEDGRRHALTYDVRRVMDEHFFPALEAVEQRFAARRPVTVPSRLEQVAA